MGSSLPVGMSKALGDCPTGSSDTLGSELVSSLPRSSPPMNWSGSLKASRSSDGTAVVPLPGLKGQRINVNSQENMSSAGNESNFVTSSSGEGIYSLTAQAEVDRLCVA